MAHHPAVKMLEESRVSPPPGSVPNTTIPLTFFDILWFPVCPMQSLYFYRVPHSSLQHLSDSVVPSLKHSLSLALRHFFPFAGFVVTPPPPEKSFLIYSEGDSVPFSVAVAESVAGDFDALFANCPRGVRQLHPFVPALPPLCHARDGARSAPLMAIQVTFLPGSGFVIGVTFCHVVADGKSFHHFMKSWASLCNPANNPTIIEKSTPFFGRDIMKSLDRFVTVDILKSIRVLSTRADNVNLGQDDALEGKVRTTFLLSQTQIDKLKKWVKSQDEFESADVSSFAVTCALAWTSVIKSESIMSSDVKLEEEPCYFVFVADCRDRLGFPVPSEYFGNCLALAKVSVEKRELLGPKGIFTAAKAIGEKVRSFEISGGAMEGAETWMRDFTEVFEKYHIVTVAGSPRLGHYEKDFGWGRPAKIEIVHTDVSGAISLCDRSDGQPGIELSLALTQPKMNYFTAVFEQILTSLELG